MSVEDMLSLSSSEERLKGCCSRHSHESSSEHQLVYEPPETTNVAAREKSRCPTMTEVSASQCLLPLPKRPWYRVDAATGMAQMT